jgi:glyoxylase-like metal-dependent hydrolase (beta-lactamase superfamily II)
MTLPLSFFLDGEAGKLTVPATSYLIEHFEGRALFDTGLGKRFQPGASAANSRVMFGAAEDIGTRLLAIGVDPASIRWIINSHLHTDHAGGNVFLPNASVILQDAEWQYAFHAEDRAYHLPEFDLGQPFVRVRGEHDLYGDGSVVLFPTPGHTPGHQSARVRTAQGDIVLAADCCNLRRSLDELHLPDHCHDAEQYMHTLCSLAELRRGGAQIHYGHDPEFWATVPQGVVLK